MFGKLFAESGLSLDRLKALLEVGQAGSIVKAAEGDPVRQSQYSRQIKELEDFFRIRLIERQGRGTRLTPGGRELARISRFFMLGLSNFQRGCLAEEHVFRIGAGATFTREFLIPAIAGGETGGATYATEIAGTEEMERRLHDLTLDFGVVGTESLSRPLQTRSLGSWNVGLWIPVGLGLGEKDGLAAFEAGGLPLILAKSELEVLGVVIPPKQRTFLVCDNFLEARIALDGGKAAAILPQFLMSGPETGLFQEVHVPKLESVSGSYSLAWNPRLLRLNPHAAKRRDAIARLLAGRVSSMCSLNKRRDAPQKP